MAVSAPGRFSTTTGWPKASLIFWATIRDKMSVGPPAGKGTMMRIVLFGKSCAPAETTAGIMTESAQTKARTRLRNVGMRVLQSANRHAGFLGERRPDTVLVRDKVGDRGWIEVLCQ